LLLSPLHVDRLSKAQSGIGWRPQHISTDFWLSTFERKVSAGASKSSECSAPASGERFDQEGRPVRYAHSRSPCGDSPRLRMPFGAARRGVSQSGLPLVLPACARAFRRTAKVALVSATPPATPVWFPLKSCVASCLEPTEAPAVLLLADCAWAVLWPTGLTRFDT
jgi:hypothetical protein